MGPARLQCRPSVTLLTSWQQPDSLFKNCDKGDSIITSARDGNKS